MDGSLNSDDDASGSSLYPTFDRFGNQNSAISFLSNPAKLLNNSNLKPSINSDFTFTIWVYPTSFSNLNGIFSTYQYLTDIHMAII